MNLNTIEVPLGTRPTTRAEEPQIINAEPSEYVYNRAKGQLDKTLDASIDASIVINSEDREYINEECSETSKLLNVEREAKREMYFRHSRLLYPEIEGHLLSLAVDAFMEQEEQGIDITKYKFDKDADKY